MQAIRTCLEKALRGIHGDLSLCCTGCINELPVRKLFTTPCGHRYCSPCLRQLALVSLDNLELFPAKCCQEEIPLAGILSVMSSRTKKRYIAQSEEQAIPPHERMYCPRPSCGRWMPPKSKGPHSGTRTCSHCRAKVCCGCRELAHGSWPCSEDEDMKAVLNMAKENKWQRCTNCHYVVEKMGGCNHISCICGYHFCYICGGRHKKCKCHTENTTEELVADQNDVNMWIAAMAQAVVEDEGLWETEEDIQ